MFETIELRMLVVWIVINTIFHSLYSYLETRSSPTTIDLYRSDYYMNNKNFALIKFCNRHEEQTWISFANRDEEQINIDAYRLLLF